MLDEARRIGCTALVGRETYVVKLEDAKAASTLQLLFKAARLLSERAIERVRRRTKRPVRTAHTQLLPHINLAGTRLTDLANRLGVTKQAAGQLVDELAAMGMLERIPDPTDARAKLVRFSRRGRLALLDGLGVLRGIEREMRMELGDARMLALHDTLAGIVRSAEDDRGRDG